MMKNVNHDNWTCLSNQVGQAIARNWAYDADCWFSDEYVCAVGVDYILEQLTGAAIRIIAGKKKRGW